MPESRKISSAQTLAVLDLPNPKKSPATKQPKVLAPSTESFTYPRDVRKEAGTSPDRDRIAARAYELFVARGQEHGHDQEDWWQAERELRGAGTPEC